MQGLDASQFAILGKKLADDYTQNGVDLTEGLRKVAEEYSLNPDQIRRVAEAANVRTYNDMLPGREKGGEPRVHTAKSAEVIRDLNAPTKVASDRDDYGLPPVRSRIKLSADQILADYLSDKPEVIESFEKRAALEKTASEEPQLDVPGAYQLVRKLEKVAAELSFERQNLEEMGKVARENFVNIVRRLVREEHYRVEDLYKASMIARPDQKKAIRILFSEAISKMASRGEGGLPKTAEPVAGYLISDKLDSMFPEGVDMVIVDGKHPLTLSIDNALGVFQKAYENARGIDILNGKMERAKQVITKVEGI